MNLNRIAILASGTGTNAEKIIQHFKGHPSIDVSLLLSNNPGALVLEKAKRLGVPAKLFSRAEFTHNETVLEWLREYKITHVVLAGFLWLIPEHLIKAFPDHIINIHPALLPQFGGKGMYGMKVHEAVREAGLKESGITIHLVNEKYDEGKIIFQCHCALDSGCSANDIAQKIHALEYEHYPRIIEKWILEDGQG